MSLLDNQKFVCASISQFRGMDFFLDFPLDLHFYQDKFVFFPNRRLCKVSVKFVQAIDFQTVVCDKNSNCVNTV